MVAVPNRLFLAGTAMLAVGVVAAVFLVTSVLYGTATAIVTTSVTGVGMLALWYALPLLRSSRPEVMNKE